MANLSALEKHKLEKLLDIGSGYLLNFSNKSLQDFVLDVVELDIYDEKYNMGSGSKANRMRSLWAEESDYLVGKLILALIEYRGFGREGPDDLAALVRQCVLIAERLRAGAEVEDADVLIAITDRREFELLAREVRSAIARNELEAGLDRLHTFTVTYLRALNEKHGVSVARDKPLHSLVGEYVKRLDAKGMVESRMAALILKSSISVMDEFCEVRNNRSLAHPNPVLQYDEALLIFRHVTATIRFVDALERRSEASDADDRAAPDSANDGPS